MSAQTNLFDEIIVDNFAGGGGASTGIELATGRPVTIAVNHDPDAIRMHKANHPYTTHYQESVWDIDPCEVCAGRPVGLAWFSPDCKHFSKAKGGKPVSRNIRGLAWIVLKWAGMVKPRVIIVENVEEFQTWGPVRRGRPVKARQGETFARWKEQLAALGYMIEHRSLIAADYGAPTTRKRFFLIARCDGQPIVWPEPTHAPLDSLEVRSGQKKPWWSAAEIINWDIPCPSIFASKNEVKAWYGVSAVRPLADNTMRRVARGLNRFVLREANPFIVQCNHGGERFRGQTIHEPMQTITGKHGYGVIAPCLIQYHTEHTERVRGQTVEHPIMTLDTSNRYGLASAYLVEYYSGGRAIGAEEPLHTSTTHDRQGVTLAHICKFKGANIGHHPATPLHTITTSAGTYAVVKTQIQRAFAGIELGRWNEIRALLNRFCDYQMAEDEILLLILNGVPYYIADIGLRMLTPRELYMANGFPPDYIIDRDDGGKVYGKTAQVARCGNAVPPPFAEALVRANLPEWCGAEIKTMEQFESVAAV